jgi:mannose-6-phosphate isomerase-like protein (cupin superfamily)
MNSILEYIESGILEMYVLGLTTREETKGVEQMAEAHLEIRNEIEIIRKNIESYIESYALAPAVTIKPFLMAIIDFSERMKNGEPSSFPPILSKDSQISHYSEWLNRKDMVLPEDFNGMYAKIIGYTPEATTAIVWLKNMAPPEVHHNEFEKFLIIEGSCDITIEGKIHHLIPGDYLSIPLHSYHNVKITSEIPCKIILQRIAA